MQATGSKRCVYCDSPIGAHTQSREHVFADWIAGLYPEVPREERVDYVRKSQAPGATTKVEEWEDKAFNLRVKNLCRPCNSEFSSQIESDAQPILTPLILGQPRRLSPDDQMRVSIWAMKTILNLQLTHPDNRLSIPLSEFRWFRKNTWMIPGEQIWLAAYDGTGDWPTSYHHYALALAPIGQDVPGDFNGHAAVITVGYVATRGTGNTLERGTITPPEAGLAGSIVQIWPASGQDVDWPPPKKVEGHAGLRHLVDTFGDASAFGE